MKLILLTGLDGSGKSTLLNKLEEHSKGRSVAFIRVPKIDSALFKKEPELYKATLFVNQMHQDADLLKIPQLKVIALFSSMLLFKEMLHELNKSSVELVFCERHPLIDTGVYAKFYAGKMDPSRIPMETVKRVNERYSSELMYLLGLLPRIQLTDIPIVNYLQFIDDWFSIDQKHNLSDLRSLFGIELPDKIIYLSASPEILMERLKLRNVLEAHESLEVLNKLVPVYESVLQMANVPINKVDATSYSNLDLEFDKIKQTYFGD